MNVETSLLPHGESENDEFESRLSTVDQLWDQRAIATVLLVTLLRLVVVWTTALELAPDEAYYWDWSRQLDWGYYSKPPMIAWLIRLACELGGTSEGMIRTPAPLLGGMGLLALWGLARDLYGSRAACWVVWSSACTLGAAAAGLVMTIDAPFLCAWSWMLWSVWRMLNAPQGAKRSVITWMAIAIIATGLGLLSKQTMATAFPLVLAAVVLRREWWSRWVAQRALIWVAFSALFLLPVIWWNARNGWVTAQHTREHFGTHPFSLGRNMTLFAEFMAGQAGVLTPVLFVVMATLCGKVAWMGRRVNRATWYLLLLGPVPLAGVMVLSLAQRVQPNWPASFYLSSLVLMAGAGTGQIAGLSLRGTEMLWLRRGVTLGTTCSLILLAVVSVVPQLSVAGLGIDPLIRLKGWKKLADSVQIQRAHHIIEPRDTETLVICATNRTPVSPLAFYLSDHPRVYRWNPGRRIDSQHEIWPGPNPDVRSDAIILTEPGCGLPKELAQAFTHIEPSERITVARGGGKPLTYDVWIGKEILAWPSPRESSNSNVAGRETDSRTSTTTGDRMVGYHE